MSDTSKTILSVVSAILAVVAFVLNVGNAKKAIKYSNQYPMAAVVTNVSTATDKVTVQDFNGNLWQFNGCEDYEIDDLVACIVDGKGTAEIKDDVIISARYSGALEGWAK